MTSTMVAHDNLPVREVLVVRNRDGEKKVVKINPAEVTRRDRLVTYTDDKLGEMGSELVQAHKVLNAMKRKIREMEDQQEEYLRLVRASAPVWQYPTSRQSKAIKMVEMYMGLDDVDALRFAYNVAKSMGAHATSWRTEYNESLAVAVCRRIAEIESGT